MKNYTVFFIFLFLIDYCYGQIPCKQYDQILLEIKKSSEVINFAKKYNIKKVNFDIQHFLYPFCENAYKFNSVQLSDNEREYCKTNKWIYTDAPEEECLKQKCKKKKTLNLYFSTLVENQIIIEIHRKKFSPERLLFLYKISENSIERIETVKVFFN